MDTDSGVVAKEEMNEQGDDEQQDFDMETQKALEEMDALQNEMDILSINGEAESMKVEMEYIYFVDIQDYHPLKCFPTFLSASFRLRF